MKGRKKSKWLAFIRLRRFFSLSLLLHFFASSFFFFFFFFLLLLLLLRYLTLELTTDKLLVVEFSKIMEHFRFKQEIELKRSCFCTTCCFRRFLKSCKWEAWSGCCLFACLLCSILVVVVKWQQILVKIFNSWKRRSKQKAAAAAVAASRLSRVITLFLGHTINFLSFAVLSLVVFSAFCFCCLFWCSYLVLFGLVLVALS